MVGSRAEKKKNNNKDDQIIIDAVMANITKTMDEKFDAFRQELRRTQKQREPRSSRRNRDHTSPSRYNTTDHYSVLLNSSFIGTHGKPKRLQEGREHQQRNLEQQKKSRERAGHENYHRDEPRSIAKAKHLQDKSRELISYEEIRKMVQEAFDSVKLIQEKSLVTRHSTVTETSKEKPSYAKDSSQIVKHLPLLMKSLEAKCDLSSTLSDFVPEKLTCLEPVQPSSIVSIPQVIQEESKEESSAETKSSLFEVDYEVAYEVQSCEKEKRPETYLSLAYPVFKPHEPPDLASRGIMITTESTQHLLIGAKISETHNLIHYCQTFLTGHSFKLNVFNLSTSSIMPLFCPISTQKDAGSLEKYKCLGAGDTLDILAIKGKPPDLQEFQPNLREPKQGTISKTRHVTKENSLLIHHQERELTCYFQFKENPPDQCQQTTYHIEDWNWKPLRKTDPITQGCSNLNFYFDDIYMNISLILLFVPKMFPFDVGDLVFLQLKSTNQEYGNVKASSSLLKEEPPDPTPRALMITTKEHIKNRNQISNSLTQFVHVSETVIKSSFLQENVLKELGLFEACLESNSCLRKEEHKMISVMIQANICSYVYNVPMTVLMHLLFVKGYVIAGVKEEPPDLEDPFSKFFVKTGIGVVMMQDKETNTYFRMIIEVSGCGADLKRPRRTVKREEDKRFKPPDLDQDIHPWITSFIMIKEEPPDTTYNPKLNPSRSQGKCNMSSSFNTDLVSFCADKLDLRSNPFQVGEDDVIMTSKETKETKENNEQLVPELNGVIYGPLEQLVAKEAKEEEDKDLHLPLEPMTRTKAWKFNQVFHQLLHSIQGQLECVYPTTLVVIQTT